MKKIFCLILSMVLLLGTFPPFIASAEEDTENLALGKKVTASSTLSYYSPNNIIDGDLKTIWARSEYAPGAYIQVDLGTEYRITKVVFHNRPDIDDGKYRSLVNLEFSNTPDFAEKETIVAMGEEPADFGVPVEVDVNIKKPYRYVRAVKQDLFIFVLAEMEIYGHLVDPNAAEVGEDVAGTSQEYAITLLSKLGMIDNVNEDIFGVDHLMTRAEAAEMVVNAFGAKYTSSGHIPFTDVERNHPRYDAVLCAYELGYITGYDNTTFRPDDYITKKEFLYMTLRAIGYGEPLAKFYNNSLTKMIQFVRELDLLNNIETKNYDEPISRGNAAVVFYNALMAPVFDFHAIENGEIVAGKNKDESLLQNRYDMVVMEGIVEKTTYTSLNGSSTKGDYATISGRDFVDNSGITEDYLGQSVYFVTDYDKVIYAWPTESNNTVVLPAAALVTDKEDIKSNKILTESADGKKTTYKLSEDFDVIRNGVAYPYYEDEDLLITNGQLRLLDNDNDRTYEVVFIEEYTAHYVESSFSSDDYLVVMDANGNRLNIPKEKLSIKSKEGNTLSVGKVASDTVIKLFSTPDGEGSKIVVYNKPMQGIISTFSDNDAEIDSVPYNYSLFYKNNKPNPEPNPGDAVNVYIDEAGEILWIEPNKEAGDSKWIIAYSQKVHIPSGFDNGVMFRMYTQDGSWNIYEAADKLKLDGSSVTVDDLIRLIGKSGSGIYQQELLRFKLNSAGKICELDTVNTNSSLASYDDFQIGEKIPVSMYTASSSAFWDYHNMVGQAKRDTPVFIIPVTGGKYSTSDINDSLFSMSDVYSVCGNNNRTSHNLLAYMPDEYGYPVCFVRTTGGIAEGSSSVVSSLAVVEQELAPIMVVQDVRKTSADGENYIKVTGRNVDNGGEVSFLTETDKSMVESGLLYQNKPECFDVRHKVDIEKLVNMSPAELNVYVTSANEIGFGDIIRYQPQSTAVRAVERVFDYDEELPKWGNESQDPGFNTWYTVSGGSPTHYNGFYRFQFASFKDITKETFIVETLAGLTEVYPRKAFTTVLVCNTDGVRPALEQYMDIAQFAHESNRVMLYSYNGSPRVAIIYPY